MSHGERGFSSGHPLRRFVLAVALLAGASRSHAVMDASTECLIGFDDVPDAFKSGGVYTCTDCDPSCDADGVSTVNGSCTFRLKACVNEADATCTATELKKVRVGGKCGASALAFTSAGAAPTCGADGNLTVRLKKRGKNPGKCKVRAKTLSASKPRRVDKDLLTLVCNPRTAGEACPTAEGCKAPPGVTVTCEPLVKDAQGISGTYQLLAVPGPKLCQTNASVNRFGPCSTDADCGGGAGNCSITPFATADGVVLPFPEGIKTIFTIAAEDPAPPAGSCNHSACIPCGNDAPCPGIPGCNEAGNPAACIRATCCDAPGFTIPTFLVPLLGGLCSRLDMYRCGFGAVNSSNPQVGDNEITKTGDTTDPGPDCQYGTADDPPAKACTTTETGAGSDLKGKVTRTVGNAQCDPPGIQYRMAVPSLSTTWQDTQSPQGQCIQGSTFDPGELKITQLVLNAEFVTAGATGSFADLSGDGCARAGAGFTNFNKNGPFTLGAPPGSPQPYDGSAGSVAVSAGIALSGGGPLFDLGFIAVLTNGPMTRLPTQLCTCNEAPGCPE
jgi:hypothetical protein